jgi:predicted HTH domain antitoxin
MTVTLELPEDVAAAIRIPPRHLKQQLGCEMALSLYAQGYLSMGMARKLSGLDKWRFLELLSERHIQRHYDEADLCEDLSYAKSR